MTKFILILFFITFSSCGGSHDNNTATPTTDPSPSFSPATDDLSALIKNTFLSSGKNITVTPTMINFDESGSINQNDVRAESFTLTNNSGSSRIFKLQISAATPGFSLLDENSINIGSWSNITLNDGESRTFNVRFDAWTFGEHVSAVVITADIAGEINLPVQATVTGAADFRIISTGYQCSDSTATDLNELDFRRVAGGTSKTLAFKICNTGGEDVTINSASINPATFTDESAGMTENSSPFTWNATDSVDPLFASGIEPNVASFTSPTPIPYSGALPAAVDDYSVSFSDGDEITNATIKAGQLATLNVVFSPALTAEAPSGQIFEPVARNAMLKLQTSLGPLSIPLLGASAGEEPILQLSYRLSSDGTWREINLNNSGAALAFGEVKLFEDWVAVGSVTAEILAQNVGSGSKTLQFSPTDLAGYFEYAENDDGTSPNFPLSLPPGSEGESFKIKYHPTPNSSDQDEKWDFGQFEFEHTGGGGPNGYVTLVGDRTLGYAVQLKLGDSDLDRTYETGQGKNFCALKIDDGSSATGTNKTFTVVNNDPDSNLSVTWEINSDTGIDASPSSGSLTVLAGSSKDFTTSLLASSGTADGTSLSGTLHVVAAYPDALESQYASLLTDKEAREFTVPFQAVASSSGESALCSGQALGVVDEATGTDTTDVTFIVDRITMIFTSLIEPNINRPAFKFHIPLKINAEKGTISVAKDLPLIYDKNSPDFDPVKQMRSYAHQITNACSPLPTNPYRLEYQKGSWGGDGFDCNSDGSVSISTETDGNLNIPTDTTCLPNNGGESYADSDGTNWIVFYHDFFDFDPGSCTPKFYGKISTFAYRPAVETFADVFKRSMDHPNEDETYYEDVYGAYRYDSYVQFLDSYSCGSSSYKAGDMITDPDQLKNFYTCLAQNNPSRVGGLINECSYFNFSVDAGVTPDDVDSPNPDYDKWTGYGTWEPHVDDEGNTYSSKYDFTIYNIHFQAFTLSAGDRFSFFQHPGKLMFSDLYVTLTTKRVAEDNWYDGDWSQRIAVNTRAQFTKDRVYVSDNGQVDPSTYWTGHGINSKVTNVIDDSKIPTDGLEYSGTGMGNYRYAPDHSYIVHAGWPVNLDENFLTVAVGLGAFNGIGNTSPSYFKQDSSGLGKPLYFTLKGCFVAGDPDDNQGCLDYHLDSDTMLDDPSKLVIDEYTDDGILPDGYSEDPTSCAQLSDPGFLSDDLGGDNIYMPCINYKIYNLDRDRNTNYFEPSSNFYIENDDYTSEACGYGN